MNQFTPPSRQRLDLALVERGLSPSRSRAARLIREGRVRVNGEEPLKPGVQIQATDQLEVQDTGYVGRGGEKLAAALQAFQLRPEGLHCLDVGASTGGFTDCLLQLGAKRVTAIDVGHGQMHPRLLTDSRVDAHEGFHARSLSPDNPGGLFALVVVDVSFISLAKVLPAIQSVVAGGGFLVLLIKPQFEVGPGGTDHGIVRQGDLRDKAVAKVRDFATQELGWTIVGMIPSPIVGGDGNLEFLLCVHRSAE